MMLDQRDAARIARYRPDMPSHTWEEIGPFVRAVVAECMHETSYTAADLMYAVSRHVWWCTDTAGFELDRDTLFRRDVISVSVEALDGVSGGAKGNRRSQLFRIAEALRTIDRPGHIRAFGGASPLAPYSRTEIVSLRNWATGQRTALGRSNAWVLLLLGLGAGLRAAEICAATHKHVVDSAGGRTILVPGDNSRMVPLLAAWEGDWDELPENDGKDGRLFRPGVRGHYPNMVTNFVHRSQGVGLKPQTQRLRATWIVTHLVAGTPLDLLRVAAGVTSISAFARLAPFLPVRTDQTSEALLRFPGLRVPSPDSFPSAE
jgi:integrase